MLSPTFFSTRSLKFLLDYVLVLATLPLALYLRLLEGGVSLGQSQALWMLLLLSALYKPLVLLGFRLERRIWQKTSLPDVYALVQALFLIYLLDTALSFYLSSLPRSLPIIAALLSLTSMLGIRLLARGLYEHRRHKVWNTLEPHKLKRVLMVGAGDAGSLFAREMLKHPEQGLYPIAFLDDDPRLQGQNLHGIPIAGVLEQMPGVAHKFGAEMVLFAIPSAEGEVVRRVVAAARALGLPYKALPSVYELVGDRLQISQLRDVSVEDLLRRPPVELDLEQIEGYLRQKTVLVTGAGGSIGSEIVRQVLRFYPKQIILFGRGENSIFTLQQELLRQWPDVACTALIGDVRHLERLDAVFREYHPDVVFHAAAHKHVPLMEDSPGEAVLNNVFGTRNVAQMCLEHGVSYLVNISTDKAVNPTSVMGSTKRIAEMVIAGYAARVSEGQKFISVRFGNVLGSRGSVVPTFMRQIQDGGPITVTHPDMSRYFMTIPEASRLVLQAGSSGQSGQVYVLNMGQPVKIVDLARDLIQLSGAKNIEIAFSGLRPGEKLFEELFTETENTQRTDHSEIFSAALPQTNTEWLTTQLERLYTLAQQGNAVSLRKAIQELVPEASVV